MMYVGGSNRIAMDEKPSASSSPTVWGWPALQGSMAVDSAVGSPTAANNTITASASTITIFK